MAIYQFQGTIIDKSGTSSLGVMRVDALDAGRRVTRPMASAQVSPAGDFLLQVDDDLVARYFGDATPDLFLRVTMPAGVDRACLASTERTLSWPGRQDGKGNVELDSARVIALLPNDSPRYAIEGVVSGVDGPVDGASVALKRFAIVGGSFDDDAPLVVVSPSPPYPAVTDVRGRFEIVYEAPVPNPDLLLTATLGSDTVEVRVSRAEPVTFVRIVAPDGRLERPAYDELKKRLADSGSVPPALAGERPESLEHLAARSGRSLEDVQRLANASGLAVNAGVTDGEEILFAVVDGQQTERSLIAQGIPMLRRTVTRAIREGSIRTFDEGEIDTRMGQLADRAMVLLRTSAPGTLSIGELVKTAPEVTNSMRDKISRRAVLHDGDLTSFWAAVADDIRGDYPGGTDIEALLTPAMMTLALGPLTSFHKPLIERLQTMRGSTPALIDPARIAALGPAGIDAAIEALPSGQRAPAGMTVDEYKSTVMRSLEAAYPTAWLEGSPGLDAELKDFLTERPRFSFEYGRLSNTDLSEVSEPVKADLLRLERLHRLSPGAETTLKMMDENFTGAASIVQEGRESFVSRMSPDANPTTRAAAIEAWENAAWQEFASSVVQSTYSPTFDTTVAAIPSPAVEAPPGNAPDWEALFGSLDSCACAHCQSVYSPNAYFVDLLEFLSHQRDPDEAFPSLRERLFALRPDLKRLTLDCDTATTPLPQIDLINEILELLVASSNRAAWPDTDVGTTAPAASLEAAPEIKYANEYVTAYDALLTGVYPFTVPFSNWNAQTDAMLEHLGVRRSRIIEVFGALTNRERWMWLAELGVCLELEAEIKKANPGTGSDYLNWGYSELNADQFPSITSRVDWFMAAAQLTFEEVDTLSRVNWSGGAFTITPPEACKLDDMAITGATRDELWNLQRFLRLRAALGLSIDETAKVAVACTSTPGTFDWNDTSFAKLGAAWAIAREWGLELTEALAFFSDMDRDSGVAPSLFKRVFIESLGQDVAPLALRLVDTGGTPVNGLVALTGTLATALDVAVEDIDLMLRTDYALQRMGLTIQNTGDAVNLANLSLIHRIVRMSKALKTSVRDVLVIRSLLVTDAFTPAGSRTFTRTVADVRASALSIDEIQYVLRHVITPESGLGLSEADLTAMHVAIEDGIGRAAKDGEATEDPDGVLTKDLLNKLLVPVPAPPAPTDATVILDILGGTSPLSLAAKQTFLRDKLGRTLENADQAVEKLTSGEGTEVVSTKELGERYTYLAKRLVRYDHARTFVVEWIATTFDVEPAMAAHLAESGVLTTLALAPAGKTLIEAFVPASGTSGANVEVPAAARNTRTSLLVRLDKAALVLRKLKISTPLFKAVNPGAAADPGDLPFLQFDILPTTAPVTAGANLVEARIPFVALVRLMNLARLIERFPGGEDGLRGLFAKAVAETGSSTTPLEIAVADHCGWSRVDVAAFALQFTLTVHAFRSELVYLRLEEAFALLGPLRVSASEALNWSNYAAAKPANGAALTDPSPTTAVGIAQSVARAARAGYAPSAWSEAARPVRDRLRQKQRDVLVSFLIAREVGITNENDFFNAVFLDVKVEPAVLTSRAVAATSCIQSFVQRGLLTQSLLSADGAREWKWMKAYRVWEANRKVFLYPENYLEPELRDDKSPLFLDLVQRLRQGALTYEATEEAYRAYLAGLAEVANLEVVAVYEEVREANEYSGTSKSERVVHVFGRTTTPHQMFHRMRRGGRWTAWERMGIEVQSDHFVVHDHGGRIYLIWLKSEAVSPEITPVQGQTRLPRLKLGCGLGYSIRNDDGVWSRPMVQGRDTWVELTSESPTNLLLTARTNDDGMLEVRLGRVLDATAPTIPSTQFVLDPCSLVFKSTMLFGTHRRVFGYSIANQRLQSLGVVDEVYLPIGGVHHRAVLYGSRSAFQIAPSAFDAEAAQYVYRDDRRSFFIERHRTFQVRPTTESAVPLVAADVVTKFSVKLFYHPFVCELQKQLASHGLVGLLDWSTQPVEPLQLKSRPIAAEYQPSGDNLDGPFPEECLDFDSDGPYSIYNWELFFHIPLFMATRLMQEQRFEEAQKWFHFIFDPTDGRAEQGMKRFWRVKPFYAEQPPGTIVAQLTTLPTSQWTEAHHRANTWFQVVLDAPNNDNYVEQIAAWRDDPFDPHTIARLRPGTYQKMVFIRYVENLMTWGDQLFARDTLESTNEATNLYLLAQDLLGPRPALIDRHLTTTGRTYEQLDVDEFSNAMVTESLSIRQRPTRSAAVFTSRLPPVWRHLYFCTPTNDKLIGLWDLVEDRLFKLRNALSIEGIRRVLPLFAPPIDPLLLVRAAAAGLSFDQVLDGGSTGPYRFATYLAKAIELAQTVAGYGQAFLAAAEKLDGERLANLRAEHELRLQETVRETRKAQIVAAEGEVTALEEARNPVQKRLDFYTGVKKTSVGEQSSADAALAANRATRDAEAAKMDASVLALYPTLTFGLCGWASSPVSTFDLGGTFFAKVAELVASSHEMRARQASYNASSIGTTASYERRWEEWQREKAALAAELDVIDKQIATAQLRVAVARAEAATSEKQIAQSQEVAQRMLTKYTNDELYDWMKGQITGLHRQMFELAFTMARRAQRAFQIERDDDLSFIDLDYFNARRGLFVGEALLESLRRLESHYYATNTRELEITKHVSLAKHAPAELLALRENGVASFQLTESDFDRDYPDHHLRRIKTASISLQCATGPHEGVMGMLSLSNGEVRRGNDTMSATMTPTQGIVTSEGREDGGLFELALRDERFLPFEGVGAQYEGGPQWSFELTDGNELDYRSISDMILHLRYTARRGGVGRGAPPSAPRTHLIPLHSQFADAWESFVEGTAPGIDFEIPKAMLPARKSENMTKITSFAIFARWDGAASTMAASLPDPVTPTPGTAIGGLSRWDVTDLDSLFDDAPTYRIVPGSRETLVEAWIIVTYEA